MNTYRFGTRSQSKIDTLHPDLVRVLELHIRNTGVDCTIVCGARGREAQEEAFATGASKKRFPHSNHNVGEGAPRELSDAFDFAPWIHRTINWTDEGSFYAMAGAILLCGMMLGVELRYGGDWDRDGLTEDQAFQDLGHIERVTT